MEFVMKRKMFLAKYGSFYFKQGFYAAAYKPPNFAGGRLSCDSVIFST